MDTTEELNGTYFYHGQSNLSAGELFDVIFLEQFCDELGIGIESGAAILAGQPWLKTRTKPGEAIKGTSVISPGMGECFYEMHELLLVLEFLHPLV